MKGVYSVFCGPNDTLLEIFPLASTQLYLNNWKVLFGEKENKRANKKKKKEPNLKQQQQKNPQPNQPTKQKKTTKQTRLSKQPETQPKEIKKQHTGKGQLLLFMEYDECLKYFNTDFFF